WHTAHSGVKISRSESQSAAFGANRAKIATGWHCRGERQMPRFVIAANVQYRDRGQAFDRNATILAVAPGDSTVDWQSEKVLSADQLKQLFKTANDKKRIGLMMKQAYANPSFANNRNLDLLSLQFNEKSSTGTGGRILSARCKDLTVMRSLALTKEILELAS